MSARSRARRTQQRARRAGLRQRAGGAAAARSTTRAFSDRRDGGRRRRKRAGGHRGSALSHDCNHANVILAAAVSTHRLEGNQQNFLKETIQETVLVGLIPTVYYLTDVSKACCYV